MGRLSEQKGRGGSAGMPKANEGRDNFIDQAGNLKNSSETVYSSDSTVAVDLDPYASYIVTGGTDASEDVTVGDGTGAIIGQRKLIYLLTRTSGSDVVNLDHANIANSAGTQATNVDLDAAGEFVLLEWNGSKWQIIRSSATVAP